MSGAQTSPAPNILFNAPAAYQAAQQYKDNELLMQQHQQQIGAADTEMAARIAGSLLTLPDEQARAAAYPTYLAQARANNYRLPHAPETYPGEAALRVTAQMGTPSADLFKLGIDRQAKGAIAPGDGTAGTGSGGGGGGGTGTAAGGVAANAGVLRDQLVSTLGVSPVDAGAILSNFHAESGLNAGINEIHPVIPGSRGGYGLAQWTGPRRYALEAFAQKNKLDVSQPGTQLAFMKEELQQPEYAGVLTAMQAAQTPEEKAAIFFHGYLSGNAPSLEHNLPGHVARARAYAGLPAATAAPTQPQGPPGGATAAATSPGVQMGGAPPPPPGGASGAYGGGGFGAVVGRPAAVSSTPIPAGRPTGPPVVTDQPAGSGVVAGPPGTAVVGQPLPPSPAVPGDVAAINAGIAARGGQPVTDPNATPTPARYAGNAPAPSVEAAPETGWGTGIGSGYGPQNALAPAPVQPAPARPATPAAAQPAAAQPPAADALPPLPAPTPPAPTNRNGLTATQQQDIERRRGMPNVSADELQKRVDSYVSTNAAAAEKYQQDSIAYVREARERQSSAQAQQDRAQAQQLAREAAQRDAERLKIAQDAAQAARAKEDREAVEANKPFHGNTPDAQNRNILIDGTNSGKTNTTEYQSAYADYGTEKIDANGLKYRPDMSPYATPTGKTYGEGKGGRELGKAEVGQGPLPPPVIHTAIQGNLAGLRNVDRALQELDAHPDSVGLTGLQPDWLSQRRDPAGINLRADISDILSQVFHDRSGAAVMVSEAGRMKPFTPAQTDTAVALRVKLERMRQIYLETLSDHYSTYGPEGGGRAMPRVEAALKEPPPSSKRPPLSSFER